MSVTHFLSQKLPKKLVEEMMDSLVDINNIEPFNAFYDNQAFFISDFVEDVLGSVEYLLLDKILLVDINQSTVVVAKLDQQFKNSYCVINKEEILLPHRRYPETCFSFTFYSTLNEVFKSEKSELNILMDLTKMTKGEVNCFLEPKPIFKNYEDVVILF